MNFRYYILLVIGIVSFGTYNLYSQTFGDVVVPINPANDTSSPINISFNGKIYSTSRTFPAIEQDPNALPIEKLLVRYVASNKAGDKDKILADWDPKHRAEIEEILNIPEAVTFSMEYYNNIASSKLLALVNYGKYTFCYVEHTLQDTQKDLRPVPVINEGTDVFITNDLEEDFFFTLMSNQLGIVITSNQQ